MASHDPRTEKETWAARRSGTELRRAQGDYRDSYTRDRARVIHSAAFRRLQAKTQVLGIGEGDFHRTRLTHSMEAAQIARGIVRALQANKSTDQPWAAWLPNPNLIETIALAHDLGHPPFGHGGEIALNYAMRDAGGFEGNGQTLRLLARTEAHTEGFGLDLTRRSLLGVLKYPVPYEEARRMQLAAPPATLRQLKREDWKPPKCYMATELDVVDWILQPFSDADRRGLIALKAAPTNTSHGKPKHHAFDTGIMELGDDIAYGIHDFEDAVALRLIRRTDWDLIARTSDRSWANAVGLSDHDQLAADLFEGSSHSRKRAIGGLVNALIVSVEVRVEAAFEHPLLRFQAALPDPARQFLDNFRSLVADRVIKTPQVQTLEYRGQQLVLQLFEALAGDPQRLLKGNFAQEHSTAGDDAAKLRIVCDYVAGVTDEYATRMYERLFVPRQGQFSDRL
jgi:dGTPase